MNRFLTTTVLAGLLCAWVGAQGSLRLSADQQAKLVERNRDLYRAAVDNGLNLTDLNQREDPLYRAKCFTKLAEQCANEVDRAAQRKDTGRVTEIGDHLSRLVDEGVVPNLEIARQNIKAGSQREKDLRKQRDDAVKVLEPLEKSLRQAEEYAATANKLANGRAKVEKAAKIEK